MLNDMFNYRILKFLFFIIGIYSVTINCTAEKAKIIELEQTISNSEVPEFPDYIGGGPDKLIIKGLDEFPDNRLIIINRWGKIVYETKQYHKQQQWDGTYEGKGTPLPEGTYYYILILNTVGDIGDLPKEKARQTGSIHILR